MGPKTQWKYNSRRNARLALKGGQASKIWFNIFGVMGNPKQVYISPKSCEKKMIFATEWCRARDIATTGIMENRL